MRLSEMALAGSLALSGCESGSVKLDDTASHHDTAARGCDLTVYLDPACPTDACPAIEHADALVDLRTSVWGLVRNVGDEACDATEAELHLDGSSLGLQELPVLEPGQEAIVYNDESIFTQPNSSLPGTVRELSLNVHDIGVSTSFAGRTGVGCIVKGHLLEYVQEDMGIPVGDCAERPFGDINTYNPYCGAIESAKNLGWVTGEADATDIDSDGDTGEIVYNAWTCANHAATSAVLFRAKNLPWTGESYCADVDAAEWYAPYMNAVEENAPGTFVDVDGNCNPAADTIRPELEHALSTL